MPLEVKTVFPGCAIAKTSTGDVQFGSPSDIIKLLQNENIDIPSTVVLPDDFFAFGINQASIEFPLYYFLFIKQGFFKNERFVLMGTRDQVKRARKILQLTLLGPTDQQMKAWKIQGAEQMRKELNFMALRKPGTQTIAQIKDIVREVYFDNGVARLNGATITKTGHNTFRVDDADGSTADVDVTITRKQPPPLPINIPERRVFGGILAMRAINTLSGFDPHGYTTGFILWVNGIMISIDGVSWMEDHLLIHGISIEKLRTYILTHIHDDHSSIVDQIISSKRVTIITARVVFECFIHKLASILEWRVSKVHKLVDFIEAVPGGSQRIFGATFNFWHTLHSIPTIGFKVAIKDKSYIFTGDMAYGKKLEEAYDQKVISKEKYEHQSNLPYEKDVTKIFFDGGGGVIHPNPSELKSIGSNVLFFHTGDLGPELSHVASLAKAGTTWISIPSRSMFIDDFTTFANSPLFKDASLEWQRILLNSSKIENYNEGDFVIKEGEEGGNFHLVLSGTFDVISDTRVIMQLQEGDFFGEAALIFNKLRNISIKLSTPGACLRFPGDLFYMYAVESGIDKRLRKIKRTKPLILKIALFRNLTPGMANWLSELAEEKVFEKGEVLIREGDPGTEFFVIESGRVRVDKRNGRKSVTIATLSEGQFVGEMGILGPVPRRSATVIAESRVKTLIFTRENLEQIIESNPYLNLTIGKVMDQRFDQNRKLKKAPAKK